MPTSNAKKKSNTRTASKTAAARKKASVNAKRRSASHGTRKRKSARKKKSSWWAWPVTIVMLLVLVGVAAIVLRERAAYQEFLTVREMVDRDTFYDGVTIDGQSVAGYSYDQVMDSLRGRDSEQRAQLCVNLVSGGKSWTITADDLDYQSDFAAVARDAYQVGHQGSVQQRYAQIRSAKEQGAAFQVKSGFDTSLLRVITDDIAASLSTPSRDAYIETFSPSTLRFTFAEEQTGSYVDPDALYEKALSALTSGVGNQVISVEAETLYPTMTVAELSASCGLVAKAETRLYDASDNRRTNISLALGILTGVRVEPGVTFSFNDTVGQRTEARGFRMAGAFVDGLSGQEVGGGICQVSTTLYNAVAKAGLTVVSRSPHSQPVVYVTKGKDAAVSWPNQDFRFMNSSDQPVFIVGDIVRDERNNLCVDVWIYGKKLPDGQYITIEAEVVEELDPAEIEDTWIKVSDLPTGEFKMVSKARTGYKTVSYKILHDAQGNEISREEYFKSTYQAAGNVYHIGK